MVSPSDRFDPNDPAVQILLLAQRVENLGREKEDIERDLERERAERENSEKEFEIRIAKMERTMTMGWGVVAIVPILGSIVGFLALYVKVTWRGQP